TPLRLWRPRRAARNPPLRLRTSRRRRAPAAPRSSHRLEVAHRRRSRVDRVTYFPGELPTIPRRVMRPACERTSADTPHITGIDHTEMRGLAGLDRSTVTGNIETGNARGLPRHRRQDLFERADAGLDERGQHDRERRLDTEHARRRFLERHVLCLG